MIRKKRLSRLTEALLEMAEGQHRIGLMDDATYNRIRARHLGEDRATKPRKSKTSVTKGRQRTDPSGR